MPISFICPHCGNQTTVADEYAGTSGPCTFCAKTIIVPQLPQAGATAPKKSRIGACGVVAGILSVALLLMIALLCAGVCSGIKGCIFGDPEEELRKQQAIDEELAECARQEVPELQELIDTISSEIADRKKRLDELKKVLAKVNKDPESDEEYKRWSDAIREMEKTKEDLLATRDELYLAFRKYELAPSETHESSERREAITRAKRTVELINKLFHEQTTEIEISP